MNGKKLWVHFWTDRQKQSKRNNCNEGLKFLMSYDMTEPENVLKELQAGLRMTIAGKWGSGYVVIMPNIRREEELIRNRLATHPFEPSEWPIHEILGLPNRRYSIFIYNEHTCPQYASIAETDWRMEYSEGIPVYEKGFNVAYLNRTFPKLKRILISIYQGGTPQPTVLKPITTESKNNKNMKKNVQRINESQLRAIVAESVKKLLREDYNPYTGEELKPQANNQAYNFQINAATQRMQQPTIISLLDKSYNFLNNATQNPKYSSMYIENAMKLIAQVKMYLQANS